MGSDDETPTRRRYPTAVCPHCLVRRRVMPSGLLELHSEVDRWAKRVCRGSGQRVRKPGVR